MGENKNIRRVVKNNKKRLGSTKRNTIVSLLIFLVIIAVIVAIYYLIKDLLLAYAYVPVSAGVDFILKPIKG